MPRGRPRHWGARRSPSPIVFGGGAAAGPAAHSGHAGLELPLRPPDAAPSDVHPAGGPLRIRVVPPLAGLRQG
eukprot:7563241-Pyramimonas_sp.AAC.1